MFFLSSGISEFSIGILAGIISSLILSRFVEPIYDSIIDGLKYNSRILGKFYKTYKRTIGRIIFLKKNKRLKPFSETGYEYKIYNINNKIECYKSHIIRLDENIFKQIQGEISRTTSKNKSFTSYFKGFIKNKKCDYLIWEESYKNEEGNFHITGHYKIQPIDSKDIPGICIEERNGKIINSFSILSFERTTYTSVQNLLINKNFYKDYLTHLNIDYDKIIGKQNWVITTNH